MDVIRIDGLEEGSVKSNGFQNEGAARLVLLPLNLRAPLTPKGEQPHGQFRHENQASRIKLELRVAPFREKRVRVGRRVIELNTHPGRSNCKCCTSSFELLRIRL